LHVAPSTATSSASHATGSKCASGPPWPRRPCSKAATSADAHPTATCSPTLARTPTLPRPPTANA
jgi:hypothetical protein